MGTAKVSGIESEKATRETEFETCPKMRAKTNVELTKNLEETSDEFLKKAGECNALRIKLSKLEIGLTTLSDASQSNEKKIKGLEPQMALVTKAFAHLATLVRECRTNCLWVTAENFELHGRAIAMK